MFKKIAMKSTSLSEDELNNDSAAEFISIQFSPKI